MTAVPAVAFRTVTKTFGPVEVLHGVTFDIGGAEIHALIGENGAGKSTLMKILGGYQPPTSGQILLDGQPVTFHSSRDAETRGVVLIHQEFNLADDLSVAQNIFLGRELGGALLNDAEMNRQAADALTRLDVRLDPRVKVKELSVPQKQLVEIAKALARDARVLVMDEPTATLTNRETDVLFALIRRLRGGGVTILYISHKLDEVQALADSVTVLRDGAVVFSGPAAGKTPHDLANLMVGRELEDMFPDKGQPSGKEALHVEGLEVPGWAHDISFTLQAGEVLGFAGLVGSGRTELFEGLLGLRRHTVRQVRVAGRPTRLDSPGRAAEAGVVYLSEDRKGKGLLVEFQLRPNLTLMTLQEYARPLLDTRAEARALEQAVETYGIRTGRLDVPASALSGGNQQKLALARILEVHPDVIVLDEPTRGVDVGAKREIYLLIQALAASGKGVIVISSELTELLGLCQRLLVVREGRIVGNLTGGELTEQEVIQYATGLKAHSPALEAAPR
ncbi:ribose transport system ATP-binding protein [Deinococcus radiopugnans ATCC 19172]|uniref:Ribose transport system ATP-binding protein n=1 Tax=Deinococcus radiopugnans ATCC 19172 TaxID=585398 RepID=A0A5C4YB12_9DEIO|nr:ribose transport system ATP-binding protein [Deinococcus radiopugnans ATCC 19172]TNM72988.1 sugar ABC transporter ATP-binding protein [Deinococcus radiopugnans ATCC 19172]